jgi:hypothetical protein
MHGNAPLALSTAVVVDDQRLPATPPRYFETAERPAPVLDVQAVQGGADDGGPVIHLGGYALTPAGAVALRDHLRELLEVLDC